MHRLESSTTSVNAAWQYLLENGVAFDKPVKQITSRALQKASFKPLPPPETKVKFFIAGNAKRQAGEFLALVKEKAQGLLKKLPRR